MDRFKALNVGGMPAASGWKSGSWDPNQNVSEFCSLEFDPKFPSNRRAVD